MYTAKSEPDEKRVRGKEKMCEVGQSMETFENNLDWFNDNYNNLEKQYANKVLAIKNQKVIAVYTRLEDLLAYLKKKNEDVSSVYVGSIPAKGMAFIL